MIKILYTEFMEKKVNYITPLFKEDLRQNQNTEIIK